VSVPLLREVYSDHTRYEILPEIASHDDHDSHGDSATELAEGRFGTWTGKIRGGERGCKLVNASS